LAELRLPITGCLIDNSAWARVNRPAVSAWWAQALVARRVVGCDAFLIEALYSARSGEHLRRMRSALTEGMPQVRCDERTWKLALDAQERMADAAGLMHRRKPIDFLIAATAHQHGLGVLHYDHDYDLIAEHAGLRFDSVWAAAPGTLDR
jgi:predicted nucleic acid-binding protein